MQKRARNLAAKELLIEFISERDWKIAMIQGLIIPFIDEVNIKSPLEVMMFGWGSVSPLPFYKQKKKKKTKDIAGGLWNWLLI